MKRFLSLQKWRGIISLSRNTANSRNLHFPSQPHLHHQQQKSVFHDSLTFTTNSLRYNYCRGFAHKSDTSVEEDDPSMAAGRGDKVLKLKIPSTRIDIILKAGLNISRSKIEKLFYDDRIRLNGVRPKKKSQLAEEGDEIDIVRGTNKINPLFIDVNRVELAEIILSSTSAATSTTRGKGKSKPKQQDEDDDNDSDDETSDDNKIRVVLKRFRNLTIENYDVRWKGPVSDEI